MTLTQSKGTQMSENHIPTSIVGTIDITRNGVRETVEISMLEVEQVDNVTILRGKIGKDGAELALTGE